jgi:lysophospholipid acyltransferase (LPLAT)-like uncharacterized protein
MSNHSSAGLLERVLMRNVVPVFALALIRFLDATWRYRETGRENIDRALASPRPTVAAFLHGRTFLLMRFVSRPRNGRWLAMCSKSLDGDAMAKVEEALGFEVVRGSSGRDGLEAIVDMIRRVRADPTLGSCLAVDGSRGPRGHVQGGIIALAQRTGGSILPVTAAARPAHIFKKSWDRTMLALPFARVDVVYGESLDVPPKLQRAELEKLRAELEERMVALQALADELSGLGDQEPVRAPLAT